MVKQTTKNKAKDSTVQQLTHLGDSCATRQSETRSCVLLPSGDDSAGAWIKVYLELFDSG